MLVNIPLSNIPNQEFSIILGNQNCQIHIYQRGDYLYMDLVANDEQVFAGRICLSQKDMILYPTNKFVGDLFFDDEKKLEGIPNYKELGTRYKLYYVQQENN